MRNYTLLPAAPDSRDAAMERAVSRALRSALDWVAAQHHARLDPDGTDIAITTASALGATRQQITDALRRQS